MTAQVNPHDLARFVVAQEATYDAALDELRRGSKRGHWMWFMFPQISGLGRSPTAQHYAVESLEEARAYLNHPLLGPRLRECVSTLQNLVDTTAVEVFGEVDAMKLRSSLTLFIEAGAGQLFQSALYRWFAGLKDQATLDLLRGSARFG